MSLTPQDVRVLSRLVDAAAALPELEREPWLLDMPAAERHLVPHLRRLLAALLESDKGAATALPALPGLDSAPG